MKSALVTGANGQDGILLSRYLLTLGYKVYGTVRGKDREVERGVQRHVITEATLTVWEELMAQVTPDEIYLLGADSFAGMPLNGVSEMLESNVMLMAHQLEAASRSVPGARVFAAGSAAVFGDPSSLPQTETTPRLPTSLYGSCKALLHPLADLGRRSGQFVSIGMLFNHESLLRPERFVTRKITSTAARIAAGSTEKLKLGNLDVVRDWGHAEDYVKAMHLILQAGEADDWVIATGEGHTVREFCQMVFESLGLNYLDHVLSVPEFWRPAEKVPLIGDSSRLMTRLGWRREKSFTALMEEMVAHDVQLARSGHGI
ncbi:MAG: GDP-mannose 4,6-dehydratase [Verrucomicrobiales bacterium]|nr:GDP-mannose 4,6-dehydratase [Verrucomicrobiales bacterium]